LKDTLAGDIDMRSIGSPGCQWHCSRAARAARDAPLDEA
jgi:hypothetical protein